jgi:hypothetical protein
MNSRSFDKTGWIVATILLALSSEERNFADVTGIPSFPDTAYLGGRHQRRLDKIAAKEKEEPAAPARAVG